MDENERATRIAQIIQDALLRKPTPAPPVAEGSGATTGEEAPQPTFTVTREGGCLSCDPGVCWVCGHLFTGERIIIRNVVKGERVLSDRTLHLLSHGITRYPTKYIVRGEPVIVDLDLDELAGYLDL